MKLDHLQHYTSTFKVGLLDLRATPEMNSPLYWFELGVAGPTLSVIIL